MKVLIGVIIGLLLFAGGVFSTTTYFQILCSGPYSAANNGDTVNTSTGATFSPNLDGTAGSNYVYSNGTSATYTIGFTSLPAAGIIRYITVTFGAASSGAITLNWTGTNAPPTWIGTTGASATSANTRNTYVCEIESTGASCSIVKEGY